MAAFLESDSDQLRKFAYTTLHHFQEPVRMIGVYAEMLEQPAASQLPPDLRQPLEYLHKAASKMQKLLQGLAEFIHAAADDVAHKSLLRLDLPLRQAILNLNPDIKASGANITFSNLPSIAGDFDSLQLLFKHLLQNAILFRAEPAPQIVLNAVQSTAEWTIEVRDNGRGIAPEFADRVFEPYARLQGNAIPGNGLGLSVCRAIVEKHGGKLWLKSAVGQGSSFFFTLPAAQD
jgi:two-component system, chemotaxis family, sensor kinase Cph1